MDTAVAGLCFTSGELISTPDSQVYKYVKSILIVSSKAGKESILSDKTNTADRCGVRGPTGQCPVLLTPLQASLQLLTNRP